MKRNRKGFTLAELLVVIAILAILVAVAIPVFTAATGKAEEAVEVANARSVYAQGMVEVAAGTYKDAISETYSGKAYTFTWDADNEIWKVTVGTGFINEVYSNDAATGVAFDKVVMDGKKDTNT